MLQWPSLAGTPHAPLPTGVAGLSRSDLTLQPQLAICLLTSEVSLPGMAFFGSEPFHPMPPTPPLKHPSDPACLVDHEGVPVNGQAVRFAARMLELDSLGHGGVKISTAVSHTNRTIFGANSMKQVSQNTACLAFPGADPKAEQAVVISGFQTERPRLSFSSTLDAMKTTCGNFDLTLRSWKLKWHYIASNKELQ
ncbi:unnamed protein product [Musa acuminata subsp. burmannicoides]